MKKTLILGVSTAVVMTSLTGCVFDRPVTTKYGIDPPDEPGIFQQKEEPVPDVYGANPTANNKDSEQEDNKMVPLVYGPNTRD